MQTVSPSTRTITGLKAYFWPELIEMIAFLISRKGRVKSSGLFGSRPIRPLFLCKREKWEGGISVWGYLKPSISSV